MGLFAEKGYAHVTTHEILQRTGLTHAALSYHFRDKTDFFATVFVDVRADRVAHLERVTEAADGDLWQRLVVTGCRAFVATLSESTVRRIVYVDGPAVLARPARREQDPGLDLLQRLCARLMEAGSMKPQPLEPLVALLWTVFFTAGTYIAAAESRAQARAEMTTVLIRVFEVLHPEGQ